jgi:hypothetical protein
MKKQLEKNTNFSLSKIGATTWQLTLKYTKSSPRELDQPVPLINVP